MRENPKSSANAVSTANTPNVKDINQIRDGLKLKLAGLWDTDAKGNIIPNKLEQNKDSKMCYFLSVLHAIKISPKAAEILGRIVRRISDGKYGVKFPNNKEIIITEEEIKEMTHDDPGRRYHMGTTLGDRIIERAFRRLISISRDGQTGLDLDLWKAKKHNYKPGLTIPLKDYDWGTQREAVKIILGKNSKSYSFGDPKSPRYLADQLGAEDFDEKTKIWIKAIKGKIIITAGDWGHAYTIGNIDIVKKTIEVIDPYDTGKTEVKTFQEFFRQFRYIMFTELPKA